MPEQPAGVFDQFDRFWDALATGQPGETTGVDPTQAETVRRFHDVPDVPGPDPAFLARLEIELGLTPPSLVRSGRSPCRASVRMGAS
jgi:hypothetical protein